MAKKKKKPLTVTCIPRDLERQTKSAIFWIPAVMDDGRKLSTVEQGKETITYKRATVAACLFGPP